MTEPITSSNKARNRKFSDEQLIELHSQGLSIPKLAKALGVSQRPVCLRMRKLSLKPNFKRGGVSKYLKVGSKRFLCRTCNKTRPLSQRNGTICCGCRFKKYVSTRNGALRVRYSMKKCRARIRGIPFTLTFEQFERQDKLQAGKDRYTGQQMAFNFGQGRSRFTVSLDRVDNNKGYSRDNVVFCCLGTNSKKKRQPADQFVKQLALNFSDPIGDAIVGGSAPSVPGNGTCKRAA